MGTPARVGIMLPGTLFYFLNPHIEKRQVFFPNRTCSTMKITPSMAFRM